MDVQLAPERLFVLEERLTLDEIQQRAMDKRMQAFGTGLGSLLQRPKPEEVTLVTKQRRLEPFWHVAGRAVYVYERNREYTVPTSAPDVQAVTINGTKYDGQQGTTGQLAFRVPMLEHCRAEFSAASFTDGLTGAPVQDAAALMSGPRSEVADPLTLSADGTIAVPPEHRASYVVRQLMIEIEAGAGRSDAGGIDHTSRRPTPTAPSGLRVRLAGQGRRASSRSIWSPARPGRARRS